MISEIKQYKPNDATTKLVRSTPAIIHHSLIRHQKSWYKLDLYDIYSLYIHGSYLNLADEINNEYGIASLTELEKKQCYKILKKEHHPNFVAIQNLMWNKWLMVISIIVTMCVGILSVASSGVINYYSNVQVQPPMQATPMPKGFSI